MINTFFKANLTALNKFTIFLFSDSVPNEISAKVYKNDKLIDTPRLIKKSSLNQFYIFEFELNQDFDFGSLYLVQLNSLAAKPIDTENAIYFPEFDDLFNYNGNDLGNIYSENETKFALWSPLSASVLLQLENENDNEFQVYEMKRDKFGVYRVNVLGNFENKKYRYIIFNNGVGRICNDPYAKSVSLNSEYSCVVDVDKIKNIPSIKPNKQISPLESIIYETNIRDFTEGKGTNIVNKGKYLGMVEENRKTNKTNFYAGLDYLKYLGITHVQLNPVLDFANVDDVNVSKSYNWGYDNISFFALEGSYCSDPHNPLNRMIEFKKMVNKFHENNIRVILDVCYNHVFEYENSCFEKSVPHYFFRNKKNGELSNSGGCGNDFASERYMARKLIIESTKFLVETYDIDGFRFDLMGLLDIDTLKIVEQECRKIKKDLMFYGEGWNMGYELSDDKKANILNADKLPSFSYFNDLYRDLIKGPTFKLQEKGFINGNLDYKFGFEYAFNGSVIKKSYDPRFKFSHQSINYVECHDNNTLFDKLCISNSEEDINTLLRRVNLANTILLLSIGIPFIHMGQEIGLSKKCLNNTYNIPKINSMDWGLVEERKQMIGYFANIVYLRRNYCQYTKVDDAIDVHNIFKTSFWDNNIVCVELSNKELTKDCSDFVFLINVTNNNISYQLDDYYLLYNGLEKDNISIKNGLLPNCSLSILYKI